jgi:diguanylate cyclase (GGDEF)-like protein/PAS domain S-box-containing protein
MLLASLFQARWLSREAGADTPTLVRERIALQYQQRLLQLLRDSERLRVQLELLHDPPFNTAAERSRVDADVANLNSYTVSAGAPLEVLGAWQRIAREWGHLRTIERVYHGDALRMFARHIYNLTYHIEDVSGVEYDPNRYTQDLGDVLFAKLPSAMSEIGSARTISANAQESKILSIPDRVRLARLLSAMNVDADLSTDDWSPILADLLARHLDSPNNIRNYAANAAAYTATLRKLSARLNSDVLMRTVPVGTPSTGRALARTAAASLQAVNGDAETILDANLQRRIHYETLRNRYTYVVALLAAALLVGLMLIVAEVAARREREALERARQESALRLSEARFHAVFNDAALGIAILDRSGAIVNANGAFQTIYGKNPGTVLKAHESEFRQLMRGERDVVEFEQHVPMADGQEAWTGNTISRVNDDSGHPHLAICMFRDLTDLRRSERRMLHGLTHDALTGLPNRALFEAQVREQFANAKHSPESSFAVLFIDLDRFKDINESLGHAAGDLAISQVAQRLRSSVDVSDMVARLAGDEFGVLLRSVPGVVHAEATARRLLAVLSKPVGLRERPVFIGASIGVALPSASTARGEDVIRDADIALRHAKIGGGSRFATFDETMYAWAEKRLHLTTDLRLALEQGQFHVLYQPILSIVSGEVVGCEALLRWNHPHEGVLPPSDFMPLAEQTGLAIPIGRFVVRTACAQAASWKDAGDGRVGFPINVNVSATELLDPEFEAVLSAAVADAGIEPADLTLEITESVMLDEATRSDRLVERLRAAGFGVCIDDFGTGYSSLRYLQQFKVDAIKIDRSFVTGADGGVASEPIIRTLLTLAQAYGVRVVAEGIETARQAEALRDLGCRFGQGFYYARALEPREFVEMYLDRRQLREESRR